MKGPGLHHVTCVTSDAERNIEFYTEVLGMRMVKKTVNHDDPTSYHLYYGDRKGTPGSNLTFFEWEMTDFKPGAGFTTEVCFRVPEDSLDYWRERLEEKGLSYKKSEFCGKSGLLFEDSDGLKLGLVEDKVDYFEPWAKSTVPQEHQLQGFHSVKTMCRNKPSMEKFMEEVFGYESKDGYMSSGSEPEMFIEFEETDTEGDLGKGGIHHIAFNMNNEDKQQEIRSQAGRYVNPTPVVDRIYFQSVYFQSPCGAMFELATNGPGFTEDEKLDELGEKLVLPPKLESKREQIKKSLGEV